MANETSAAAPKHLPDKYDCQKVSDTLVAVERWALYREDLRLAEASAAAPMAGESQPSTLIEKTGIARHSLGTPGAKFLDGLMSCPVENLPHCYAAIDRALVLARDILLARDRMNAELHLAREVRYSPLTSEVLSAIDRMKSWF